MTAALSEVFSFETLRKTGLVGIAALIAVVAPLHANVAHAATDCPASASEAIAKARQSLQSDSPADQKSATECLIAAVAALDEKIEGIRTGAIPLKGFVDARGGLLIRTYGKADK